MAESLVEEGTVSGKKDLKTVLDLFFTTGCLGLSNLGIAAVDSVTTETWWASTLQLCAPLIGFLLSSVAYYHVKNWEDNTKLKKYTEWMSGTQTDIANNLQNLGHRQILEDQYTGYLNERNTVRKRISKRRMF